MRLSPCKIRFAFAGLLLIVLQQTGVYANSSRSVTDGQWHGLQDKAFNYKDDVEKIAPPTTFEPNIFQKILMAIVNFFSGGFGTVLIWLLLITVIGYVVYRLFFSGDNFLFGKNRKLMAADADVDSDEEDLASTNWEMLLQNATSQNDLRLAVRYSYKWLLQLLQQRGLISYRTDKTNFDYYNELSETQFRQAFRQLSRQYEYSWYGHFEVSAPKYDEYMDLFNQVRKQIT